MLKAALTAVTDACRVTRKTQSDLSQLREITKNDRSPVTVADFAAQAVVVHRLEEALGKVLLVGEESSGELRAEGQEAIRDAVVGAANTVWAAASTPQVLEAIDVGGHDASASSYWTLDPIDGTKGFLRGGQYAVSLAYLVEGVVQLGVMGCPNLSPDFDRSFDDPDPRGLIFYATLGGGTWMVPADDPGALAQRVTADGSGAHAIRVCESVESAHTDHDAIARITSLLGGASAPARLDSQAKYAVVARGQTDAYLRIPGRPGYVEKIWDHAAGQLVATEAGACVSDIRGRGLDFSRGVTLSANHGIVCAGRGFHARLIDAIRRLGLTG